MFHEWSLIFFFFFFVTFLFFVPIKKKTKSERNATFERRCLTSSSPSLFERFAYQQCAIDFLFVLLIISIRYLEDIIRQYFEMIKSKLIDQDEKSIILIDLLKNSLMIGFIRAFEFESMRTATFSLSLSLPFTRQTFKWRCSSVSTLTSILIEEFHANRRKQDKGNEEQ